MSSTPSSLAAHSAFEGRTALVTGASGGIGGALATQLAGAGADLVLTYSGHRDPVEEVAERCRRLGAHVGVLRADLADPQAPARLVEQAVPAGGRIDILVPAAGVGVPTAWDEVGPELWETTLRVNLTAPFVLARALLPDMVGRGYGRLLFISSIAAFNGGIIGPHYAASKSALHGLVHSLAPSVAASGVTVNAIAPAVIAGTRMLPSDPDASERLPLPIPVGRLGVTDEVADLAMAVLRNGYLTNKVLTLDGGLLPR